MVVIKTTWMEYEASAWVGEHRPVNFSPQPANRISNDNKTAHGLPQDKVIPFRTGFEILQAVGITDLPEAVYVP